MTERTPNADFRRKPQIFADSPLLLEIPAFGGRRKPHKTADFRRKPKIFAESRRKPQIGLCHLRCVTFSSAMICALNNLEIGCLRQGVLIRIRRPYKRGHCSGRFKRRATERVVFASGCQCIVSPTRRQTGNCNVTQMRHPLLQARSN